MLPPQLVDTFLLDYNIGQVSSLVLVLPTVGTLLLKSWHTLGINVTLFELIFLLTPVMLAKPHYMLLGVTLFVAGPIVYVSGHR